MVKKMSENCTVCTLLTFTHCCFITLMDSWGQSAIYNQSICIFP